MSEGYKFIKDEMTSKYGNVKWELGKWQDSKGGNIDNSCYICHGRDLSDTNLSCPNCFNGKEVQMKKQTNLQEEIYKCPFCPLKFRTAYAFKAHKKTHSFFRRVR